MFVCHIGIVSLYNLKYVAITRAKRELYFVLDRPR